MKLKIKKSKLKSKKKIKHKWIYEISKKVTLTPSLYLETGAIHGCAIIHNNNPLIYMEDVGRHNAVDKICENNKGVIVTIVGTHNCVSCRGVKHQGAAMVTTKATGVFRDNDNLARKEFFDSLKINNGGHNI